MKMLRTGLGFAAFAVISLMIVSAASAQATRTWVSGVGDDANPCSRTAPCKTFAGAIAKTATAGEINCLDPGGFGALTITKSITIDCNAPGAIGGVLVSGTNGIIVAGGTQVQLIGLDIDGIGTGLNGVLVNASNVNVMIQNCLIYEFQSASSNTGSAVLVTGAGSKVYVQNTIMRNNNAGVTVAPSSSTASVELDHAVMDFNMTSAVTTPPALSGNLVVQTGGTAILNASTLTSASPAINNGGSVQSYGNNLIRNTVTGTAITTLPSQ